MDNKAINKRRREWVSAVNGRDIDSYVSLLTDDIVWFPPGHQAVGGREAIREWLEPLFERFTYEFSLSKVRCRLAGDRAVEHGTFTSKITPKAGGETMEHSGNYIVLWHRGRDDQWRIERYIDETEN